MTMTELVQWIASLPLSLTIRRISWIIPLMQTIHILAIGMILSSVIMIDLRIWGLSRSQTLAQTAHRFVPWIWSALILLTVTGVGLIMAGPRRTLLDPAFQVKMLLTVVAIPATLACQVALRRNHGLGDNAGAGAMAGFVAAVTLILWTAVTLAGRGRWIASVIAR
jgi:hypothetical protein